MAPEFGFDAVKEAFGPVANVATVKRDDLQEAVEALTDAELSLNLMPLGIQLAETGDVKSITLLAEAGKRLAESSSEFNLPLIPLAKATILHALDRFISEGCNVPEECTHFEGQVVPSEDQVLELIGIIESYDGITLTRGPLESEAVETAEAEEFFYNPDNPHPDTDPSYLTSLYQPGTRNLAFKKASTEAFYGQPISEAIVADVLRRFETDVRSSAESGTGPFANLTEEQIETAVARATADYDAILAGEADEPSQAQIEQDISNLLSGLAEALGVQVA